MSRPPLARARVFDAALRIVRTHGARGLTLQRLEQESGVSRGGINYHWRTREALLHALLDHDIECWQRRCRELAARDAVVGHIRCALDPTHGAGELLAHLLPELRDDPVARERVTQFAHRPYSDWGGDYDDIARHVLTLAAEGAFWRRVHNVPPPVPGLDTEIRTLIEAWLDPVARRDDGAPRSGRTSSDPRTANREHALETEGLD